MAGAFPRRYFSGRYFSRGHFGPITAALVLVPTGRTSTVVLGTGSVQPGTVVVLPAGVTTTNGPGAVQVTPGTVVVLPSSQALEVVFGDTMVRRGVLQLLVDGVDPSSILGQPVVVVRSPEQQAAFFLFF